MKLQICINNQTLDEVILADLERNFDEQSIKGREDYIKYFIRGLKLKYQKVINIKSWEIWLVADSKMK